MKPRIMDFETFLKLSGEEATSFVYGAEEVFLIDSVTHTDLGKLFQHIPVEDVLLISFFINEEMSSSMGFSAFSAKIEIHGTTIILNSFWNVRKYSRIYDVVSCVVKPIEELGIQNKVDINGSPWESGRKFVEKLIELGKNHRYSQFKDKTTLDGTDVDRAFDRVFGQAA